MQLLRATHVVLASLVSACMVGDPTEPQEALSSQSEAPGDTQSGTPLYQVELSGAGCAQSTVAAAGVDLTVLFSSFALDSFVDMARRIDCTLRGDVVVPAGHYVEYVSEVAEFGAELEGDWQATLTGKLAIDGQRVLEIQRVHNRNNNGPSFWQQEGSLANRRAELCSANQASRLSLDGLFSIELTGTDARAYVVGFDALHLRFDIRPCL